MVNDDHRKPNCKMKLVEFDGKECLALFAICNIEIGTELRYDYGDPTSYWRKVIFFFIPFICLTYSQDCGQPQDHEPLSWQRQPINKCGICFCKMYLY